MDNGNVALVTHDDARHRFTVETGDGRLAQLTYRLRDGAMALVHTEVPPEDQHRGIGQALARAALEYARESRLSVIPTCPFVAGYLEDHPEYASLVRRE